MAVKVAKVIVVNAQGQILLLKRGSSAPSRPNTWDLPGGVRKNSEPSLKTALRELSEETGLNLNGEDLKLKITGHRVPFKWLWDVYLAKVDDPSLNLSWEHDNYMWLDPEDLSSTKKLPEFIKKFVRDSLEA